MTRPRIASLLASGTEIVAALGLEDRLVGISHECDYPAHVLDRPRLSRPRFDPTTMSSREIDAAVRNAMAEHGSVYEVDADALAQLDPDLILTQAVCEVCAVPTPGVRETVARLGLRAQVLSLDAHTIPDIFATIEQVGRAAGVEDRARQVLHELRSRLTTVVGKVFRQPRPRVLALEWLDPVFAPGHWVPEMIQFAGAKNLLGDVGARSREVSWDEVAAREADVLVVMPCGYGLDASIAEAHRFADRLRGLAPVAFAVDGSSYFNRSGPRFADGVEILAGLLHPSVFENPRPEAAAPIRFSGGDDA